MKSRWGTEDAGNLQTRQERILQPRGTACPKAQSGKGMAGSRSCSFQVAGIWDSKGGLSGNKTAKLDRN